MAIINKKPETLAAKAAESKPAEKAVEKAATATPVAAKAAEKPAKAAKAPKTVKAPKAKAEKAPKAAKAKAEKAAKAPAITLCVEHQGRQVTAEAVVAAVKADWTGEAIKTLEVYVKPEDGAVYYVVNGTGTGKVDF